MKICLACNIKNKEPSLKIEKQDEQEYDSLEVIDLIKKAIEDSGHSVEILQADENSFEGLKKLKNKIDLVFNIAEGVKGDARESQIPIYCEVLNIPYTHSSPTTHAIGLDKEFTKQILSSFGIRSPSSILVNNRKRNISKLKYPLIIKPNAEGSSVGITNDNVVNNEKELNDRLDKLMSVGYKGDFLVEEYIDGREFTVGMIGNGELEILPVIEQKFDFLPKEYHKIAGYELKWFFEDKLKDLTTAYECPAKIDKKLEKKIKSTAERVFNSLRIYDVARVDFRMNNKNQLYFLEVNTLPGLNFKENEISYFPLAARTAGYKPKDVVQRIIETAAKRYGIAQ